MSEPTVLITPKRGLELPIGERLRSTATLLVIWVRRELRVRYRQSVLRAAWSLIQPVTILATYGFVLNRVLDVGSEDVPYLVFAWAGIVPYTFVQQSLAMGVGSIQQAGGLISRVYFPREVLPLSIVGASVVDLTIMSGVLVGLAWVQVGRPGRYLVALILVDLVLFVWVAGITMLMSALTVFRRDLNHAMPLVLRVLFIISPVMYPAALLSSFADLNPLTVVIEGTRDVAFRGQWPDFTLLAWHFAGGTAVLIAGFLVLRRLEPRMGDFV